MAFDAHRPPAVASGYIPRVAAALYLQLDGPKILMQVVLSAGLGRSLHFRSHIPSARVPNMSSKSRSKPKTVVLIKTNGSMNNGVDLDYYKCWNFTGRRDDGRFLNRGTIYTFDMNQLTHMICQRHFTYTSFVLFWFFCDRSICLTLSLILLCFIIASASISTNITQVKSHYCRSRHICIKC
ncbi:hypothetical protein GGR58DRAFT_94363 [Xylaria digitata]|nr:hypothetical protein GGR58DRAFT_94363 [Xylaria digitata]